MIETLTQKQAAALLGITPRRLRQIDNEENPPQKIGGKYPAEAFGKWQETRILRRLSITDDGRILDPVQETARLQHHRANNEALKEQETLGELIPAKEVERAWMDHVVAVRGVLLAFPSKVAPVVMAANTIREVEDFARNEIFLALDQLESATDPENELS